MMDPTHTKKDTTSPRAKDSPNNTVGEAKLHLESSPMPTKDAQRAQRKPFVHQEPGTSQETESDLP